MNSRQQVKSPEEIAAAIDIFVNEQSDKLTEAMEQHRIDEYEKSWRISQYVYDKWAKWTDESTDKDTGKRKFFSRGTAKKLAATTLIALPIGFAAGALIQLLA